jgi:hypothetical protein
VVLEKFQQPDSIFLNLGLDLLHQLLHLLAAVKIGFSSRVLRFGAAFNGLWQDLGGVGLLQEPEVLDFTLWIAEDLHAGLGLFVGGDKSEIGEDLAELFEGDLEVTVVVPVLEERFGIQAVFDKQLAESRHDLLSEYLLAHAGALEPVAGGQARVV